MDSRQVRSLTDSLSRTACVQIDTSYDAGVTSSVIVDADRDLDAGPAQVVDGVGAGPWAKRAGVDGDLAEVQLVRRPVVRRGVADSDRVVADVVRSRTSWWIDQRSLGRLRRVLRAGVRRPGSGNSPVQERQVSTTAVRT
jgi:hypothetical protein